MSGPEEDKSRKAQPKDCGSKRQGNKPCLGEMAEKAASVVLAMCGNDDVKGTGGRPGCRGNGDVVLWLGNLGGLTGD